MDAYLVINDQGQTAEDSDGNLSYLSEDGQLIIKVRTDSLNLEEATATVEVDGVEVTLHHRGRPSTLAVNRAPEPVVPVPVPPPAPAPAPAPATPAAEWSDSSIRLLIDMFSKRRDDVEKRKIKTMKAIWGIISDLMNSRGYTFSATQIGNKWKTLERSYKQMVDNNMKTGRAKGSCPYESELQPLLAKRHNVIPTALSSAEGLRVRDEQVASSLQHSADADAEETAPDDPPPMLEEQPSTSLAPGSSSTRAISAVRRRPPKRDVRLAASVERLVQVLEKQEENAEVYRREQLEWFDQLIE